MKTPNYRAIKPRRGHTEGAGIVTTENGKISLNLRKLKFESELKTMGLPDGLDDAISYLLTLRSNRLNHKYDEVFAYTWVQRFGSFWQDFGCKSLDEWLAIFDLPTGVTLANREVMVRTFSKETFLLVGDDMLGEMMYLISRAQQDSEQRKKDYQSIFDAYCKQYTSFDKTKFRETVNWYVNTNYTIRIHGNMSNIKSRPPRELPIGTQSRKIARPVPPVTSDERDYTVSHTQRSVLARADVAMDYVTEDRLCAGCREREAHILALEKLIIKKLGSKEVPPRPKAITQRAA